MLDGKQIAAFVTVAEELHLGRAASRLGVPRTTLSARLRALEAQFGFDLVDRRHRCRIALTTAGEAMLGLARELASASSAVEAAAAQVVRGERGVVRVALVSEPNEHTDELLALLRHVNERWSVDVRRMTFEAAERAMAVGGLELAIGRGGGRFRTGPGVMDPRPNRLERARGIGVPHPDKGRVTAWWRVSWPRDDHRVIHGPRTREPVDWMTVRGSHDAEVFLGILRDLRFEALDALHPRRADLRRERMNGRRAARREAEVFRDDEKRLGRDAAVERQRARDRPRIRERVRAALERGAVSAQLLAEWIVAFGPDAELPAPEGPAADP